EKFEADGDYPGARESAQAGIALDAADLYFLLHAALNNAITRNRDLAKQQLGSYIEIAQNSGGDEKQLATVYGYQKVLEGAPLQPAGAPNWYSGYKSPPGVFYCPISVMPNMQVVEVRGSHKERAVFRWSDGRLAEVTTQDEAIPKENHVFFDYFKDSGIVRRAAEEPFADKDTTAGRLTATGAAGDGKGSYVALLNYPPADPAMVERLMGRRAGTIVAGN